MYARELKGQTKLERFQLPFSGKLDPENRWVKLEQLIPWELVEDLYAKTFQNDRADGRSPISARIAFGAIYVKEQEGLVDTSTLDHIAENPYIQYFLGLEAFTTKRLFDPSMMVHFRTRFPAEAIEKINEEIYRRQVLQERLSNGNPPPSPPDAGMPVSEPDMTRKGSPEQAEEGSGNQGKLILDATAAPADIRYPTDLSLLNECREDTERMIDTVWEKTGLTGRRTQYQPKIARKKYLKIAKQRKPKLKQIMQAVQEQLDCVEKNLETLGQTASKEGEHLLSAKKQEQLEVIRRIAVQQREMLDAGTHSCPDRIVSAEKYKERFGCYPEAILGDQIYRNRDNRAFCKKKGIRLSGPRLGRPKESEAEADQALAYQDSCERNWVESRNGIAKRRFGLDLVMATLPGTAETEAALNVLAMNTAHLLRVLLHLFFGRASGVKGLPFCA